QLPLRPPPLPCGGFPDPRPNEASFRPAVSFSAPFEVVVRSEFLRPSFPASSPASARRFNTTIESRDGIRPALSRFSTTLADQTEVQRLQHARFWNTYFLRDAAESQGRNRNSPTAFARLDAGQQVMALSIAASRFAAALYADFSHRHAILLARRHNAAFHCRRRKRELNRHTLLRVACDMDHLLDHPVPPSDTRK